MSKTVRFHEEALAELEAEAMYYEAKPKGLAERFISKIGSEWPPC